MKTKRKKAIEKAKQSNQLEKHVKGLIKAVGGVDAVVENSSTDNKGKFGVIHIWVDKTEMRANAEGGNRQRFIYTDGAFDISDIIKESEKMPWEGK